MNGKTNPHCAAAPTEIESSRHEHRVERLIDRLPGRLKTVTRWLRLPSSRWVRLPVGVLLIGGAGLFILPFFGLWMLPLGLVLLAEDLRPLRKVRDRVLEWIERRRPHWFHAGATGGPISRPMPVNSASEGSPGGGANFGHGIR